MRKLIAVLIIILFSANGYAQSGSKDGSFNADNIQSLSIEIYAGMNISIIGEDVNQISYIYEFDGNDEAYKRLYGQFNPYYNIKDGEASLEIKFPDIRLKNKKYEVNKISLELVVPIDIALDIETKYSSISISNIEGAVDIINRSGAVVVSNIGDFVDIENGYGNVSATNIEGDLDIESRSSSISVKYISGDVDIESNYSKINIGEVEGDVDIENKNGVINAYDLRSDLYTLADYTEHELTNITGDVDVEARNGAFRLDGANSLIFEGDYSKMEVKNIREGGVDIENRSTNITLNNIVGEVEIEGTYLNVAFQDIFDSIYLENRTGKIKGAGLKGEELEIDGEYLEIDIQDFNGQIIEIYNKSGMNKIVANAALSSVSIDSEFGDVNLALAKVFNGVIDLNTTGGKINCEIEYKALSIDSQDDDTSIEGLMGDGNEENSMEIDVTNGNINIKKIR